MKFRLIALSALFWALGLSASAQGTGFTYQGRLQNNGSPANGSYDVQFTLYAVSLAGSPVAGPITNSATAVSNGLFTATLDFGPGVFTGTNYWLDVAVRTNGGGAFMELTPRQPLTPTPYAIYAEGVAASGIVGTLIDAQLTHSAVTVNPGPGLSGGGRVGLGNTIALTNTGVLSVTGNADITASTVGGAVTLGDTATSTNTPSTLVKRDSGGSFAAASLTLASGLTLPAITVSSPDIIYSGGRVLLYNDNSGNFASGLDAGYLGTSGAFNTAIGNQALEFNASGSFNTANGNGALFSNTSGSDNTAVGFEALTRNSGGSDNTANGYEALFYSTSGSLNTANGSQALYNNTSGSDNTANGYAALFSNTNGSDNTANGYEALVSNTSGSYNTAIGEHSLGVLTTGSNNIAVGYVAGNSITTGSDNIDIGNTGISTDTNIIRIGYAQTQTYIAGVLLPPSPVIIQTNFIDGHRYTNNYGWALMINATIVLNTAGVVGSANESLCIQASPAVGGITNPCAISTIAASAVLHYTNHIGGFVPTNAIYWFTNLSTGSGNSATVIGGQIKYP